MKKLMTISSYVLISIVAAGLLIRAFGFRINTTDSIPRGVYRISSSTDLKNAFVMFCPDTRDAFKKGLERGYFDHGHCPSGSGLLMKKVVATSGDTIDSTESGVSVNGKFLLFSKPKLNDGLERKLPQWRVKHYKLKKNELIAMTNQDEWSFDSRYYGPIKMEQIKGVITPVWVKNKVVKA